MIAEIFAFLDIVQTPVMSKLTLTTACHKTKEQFVVSKICLSKFLSDHLASNQLTERTIAVNNTG